MDNNGPTATIDAISSPVGKNAQEGGGIAQPKPSPNPNRCLVCAGVFSKCVFVCLCESESESRRLIAKCRSRQQAR